MNTRTIEVKTEGNGYGQDYVGLGLRPVLGFVSKVMNPQDVRTGLDTIFAVPMRQHLRRWRKASSLAHISGAHASDIREIPRKRRYKHCNIHKLIRILHFHKYRNILVVKY